MNIKDFIDKLLEIDDDVECEMMFQEHRVVLHSAYFSDKGVSGYDLVDASLMDRVDLDIEEICVFSWREDEPDTLKIKYTDLCTGEKKEELVSDIRFSDKLFILDGVSGTTFVIQLFKFC